MTNQMRSHSRPSMLVVLFLFVLIACDCEGNGVEGLSGELWIGRSVIDFGRVCLGDAAELEIAIENRGPVSLRFEAARISGGSGEDQFEVVSYPEELERAGQDGSTGHIVVSFRPEEMDLVLSSLFIETDERETPERELSLRGQGDDGPRTDVGFSCHREGGSWESCTNILLSDVGVGAVGEGEVRLENRGCAQLRAMDVTHEGQGSSDLYLVEAPELPFIFSNLEPAPIKVQVRPEQEDTYTSRLEVTWEDFRLDGAQPEVSGLSVIAQAVELQVVVQPSRYTFGQATVEVPQTQTFTIRNLGSQEGEVTDIELRDGREVFTVEPQGELPATISRENEIYFDVTYAPIEAGHDHDVVLVTTDMGVLEVPLMGGVIPQISVDPSPRVDFGFVEPGESVVRTVEVSNVGQANLEVSDFIIDTNPAGVFSLDNLPEELPVTLQPSEGFSFDVWFEDNVTIANEFGQLLILCNDPGHEQHGYLLELYTENETVPAPVAALEVLVEGEPDDRNPVPLTSYETVTFDASGSSSFDGSEVTFSWQIRDQPQSGQAELSSMTGPIVTLEPDFPGEWRVRVTVRDRFELSAWEDANLLVSDD